MLVWRCSSWEQRVPKAECTRASLLLADEQGVLRTVLGHHGDYVVPSPHHAGRFEEPSRSREVLEAFREAHGSDLATVEWTAAAAERWGVKIGAVPAKQRAATAPTRCSSSSAAR